MSKGQQKKQMPGSDPQRLHILSFAISEYKIDMLDLFKEIKKDPTSVTKEQRNVRNN